MKPFSGKELVKILCNEYGFQISRQKGSHVMLSKQTSEGKVGTVVPMHKELKAGTLHGILKLAGIDIADFFKHV